MLVGILLEQWLHSVVFDGFVEELLNLMILTGLFLIKSSLDLHLFATIFNEDQMEQLHFFETVYFIRIAHT